MQEEIRELALRLAGSDADGQLVCALCAAAQDGLTARLAPGIRPEDCRESLICAAALTALARLAAVRGSDGVVHFAASDLSITCREGTADELLRQAEQIMGPYLSDGFAFLQVCS